MRRDGVCTGVVEPEPESRRRAVSRGKCKVTRNSKRRISRVKTDNSPKEKWPLSPLCSSPTQACACDQAEGRDLNCSM